jgi:ADP-ribose pyrophosphatase YjhB (NUDIX family)
MVLGEICKLWLQLELHQQQKPETAHSTVNLSDLAEKHQMKKNFNNMTPAQSIAQWADKLRHISATGLRFSKDVHDRENYQIIQNITMEMFAFATGKSVEQIEPLRDPIFNRSTPLAVGDAAVINNADRLLLIQRAGSRRWALPGGALAVGETPAEGVVREVREETGIRCMPTDLIGVYDSHSGLGASPQHQYNFVFLCYPLKGKTERASHATEILDMGWFSEDSLPTPLEPSNYQRIQDAFHMWGGEITRRTLIRLMKAG